MASGSGLQVEVQPLLYLNLSHFADVLQGRPDCTGLAIILLLFHRLLFLLRGAALGAAAMLPMLCVCVCVCVCVCPVSTAPRGTLTGPRVQAAAAGGTPTTLKSLLIPGRRTAYYRRKRDLL